jgi:dienelactone hydrolase
MARREIDFDAEGVTLRGWFYPAEDGSGRRPTVVMAHGFSAVKEMYLDAFAEVFAAAGLNALVFDNRSFGASDGEPRQEIDPWQQVRDYRHAITYAGTLDDVDSTRIGVWGSSYSGGHVLVLGAIDRRVKAVVSQVPLVSGSANLAELVRADFRAGFREQFDADRAARFAARRGGRPPGAVRPADAGLLDVVHRNRQDTRARLAQRGDAAQRRDARRVRTRDLHRPNHPDPAADDRCS